MVRPIRIQYPGEVYHVMARGSHGQEIVQDDQDRLRLLETMDTCRQPLQYRQDSLAERNRQ
jgi:hypothetical protein